MKNNIFARFARAFFIFWHFEDILVLSVTWNDLFCSCVDDVSIWWQMLIFVFLCPKRWFQFNSRIVRTHFSSIMTLNNWKMTAEPRSYIFRWRSRFRPRRVSLSSLFMCGAGFSDISNWVVNTYSTVLATRLQFNFCPFICNITHHTKRQLTFTVRHLAKELQSKMKWNQRCWNSSVKDKEQSRQALNTASTNTMPTRQKGGDDL